MKRNFETIKTRITKKKKQESKFSLKFTRDKKTENFRTVRKQENLKKTKGSNKFKNKDKRNTIIKNRQIIFKKIFKAKLSKKFGRKQKNFWKGKKFVGKL